MPPMGLGLKLGSTIPASTITGFQFGTPDFGSSAGQTPVTAPVITGTLLATASSVKINTVEHISHCTVTPTAITVNQLLANTPGAFTTVSVTTDGGVVNFGNGTNKGFTIFPAGYHIWRGDLGITLSSGRLADLNDQGDLTVVNATQTAPNLPLYSNPGIINNLPTFECASVLPGPNNAFLNLGSLASLTAGHFWIVRVALSDGVAPHSAMGGDSLGTFSSSFFPFTDGNIYDDDGSSTRPNMGTPVLPLTNAHVWEVRTAPGARSAYVSGTLQYTSAVNTVAFPAAGMIGKNGVGGGSLPYNGHYEEILLFNAVLSAPNIAIVKTYLSGRTGISIS